MNDADRKAFKHDVEHRRETVRFQSAYWTRCNLAINAADKYAEARKRAEEATEEAVKAAAEAEAAEWLKQLVEHRDWFEKNPASNFPKNAA